MRQVEKQLNVQSFFVMDENFLLHRQRGMELLRLMKAAGKSWELAVLASANAIPKYTMQELVELGVSWWWMGLESPRVHYSKLSGTDTRELTRELREHGIRMQGSTIIGLEHHTPDNIRGEVSEKIGELRREVEREYGVAARVMSAVLGPVLLWTTRREQRRLARGVTDEPPTTVSST